MRGVLGFCRTNIRLAEVAKQAVKEEDDVVTIAAVSVGLVGLVAEGDLRAE